MHLSIYTNKHTHRPEILCLADSHHYLVKVADANGQLQLLTDVKGQAHSFNSQIEAETWLHQQGYRHATLCFESAYEELAADETVKASKLDIPLSH